MNEFEQRLLALLETAEQQTGENEQLLKTVRELVAYMEETRPALDRTVTAAKYFYSEKNLQSFENTCGNAVYQATDRKFNERLLNSMDQAITTKMNGISAEFDGLSTSAKNQMVRAGDKLAATAAQADAATTKFNKQLSSIGLKIFAIAIPVTIVCMLLLALTHWLLNPNQNDVRELQTEIQQLENIRAQQQSDLQTMKSRYDNALSHANTQFINGEAYMLVDTKNCNDSDSRTNIEYCRMVGGRPMPKPTPAATPRRSQQPAINYGNSSNPFGSSDTKRSTTNNPNNPF